jgi:hypothetical protein
MELQELVERINQWKLRGEGAPVMEQRPQAPARPSGPPPVPVDAADEPQEVEADAAPVEIESEAAPESTEEIDELEVVSEEEV